MAPIDNIGVWGEPTSTLDWCEQNYVNSMYIAEFWNTVSNVFMIFPPLIGIRFAVKDGLERRFVLAFFGLLIVGIGSWFFHMTLLYQMQLFDELPMIYGTCVFLYCLLESNSPAKSHNYPLGIFLTAYALVTTFCYLLIINPLFHQAAYGTLVATLLLRMIYCCKYEGFSKNLFWFSTLIYGTGFIIWNIDNIFCEEVRSIRNALPVYVAPVTQLHAWWHIFAGLGTQANIAFGITLRYRFLKKKCILWSNGKAIPFVRVSSAE
ncbi:alkaline ceramidase 3-like isoform X2 [Anneissia japonica]|uniref:alkaline ceramidase 3-like isoform X1 n=1 Tax=Anneissia japonica TaxID=1529436 RepID=UPI001425B95D|nr:alkaline ceramidase 3-like isoform X1 [Anneissia japonica]XP_033119810.1 alkaline ceramidase 3-like isoform X2 [Anneissia japonica]